MQMNIKTQVVFIMNIMSSTKSCPACFRKIKTGSNFCKYCGVSLKTCPECNSFNREEDAYCIECGTDIRAVEVAESFKEMKEDHKTETLDEDTLEYLKDSSSQKKQPTLVMWPPTADTRYYSPTRPRPYSSENYLDKEPTYEPKKLNYAYGKVRILGFLGGPLPISNLFGYIIEAFSIALALIAVGIVIFSIGLAFFQFLVFPILACVMAGAFLLSAPFFGIYYISSEWLYRAFEVKRPVKVLTIIGNYLLGSLIFSVLGLMLAPIFIQGGALGITFSVIGGIVYIMGLIIVPLKAYLADLIYVKAADNLRKEE